METLVYLDVRPLGYSVPGRGIDPGAFTSLSDGSWSLTSTGMTGPRAIQGSNSAGSLSPVPEAQTRALLIAGLPGPGFAVRPRKSPADAA